VINTVIHVGYPKTGSTTLQRDLFRLLPGTMCLNSQSEELYWAVRHMQMMDSIIPFHRTKYGKLIQERYNSAANDPRYKCVVVSDENILSTRCNDVGVCSSRLRQMFFPCKILIVIRNQINILESFYSSHGRYGQQMYISKVEDYLPRYSFEEWLDSSEKNLHYSFLPYLQYNEVIGHFESQFGEQNVQVLVYEEMRDVVQEYSEKLAKVLEADADTVREILTTHRRNSRKTGSDTRHHEADLGQSTEQNKSIAGQTYDCDLWPVTRSPLLTRYSAGNKELSARRNLALEQYGYPM
jgi:hypothetical protein